MTHKAEPLIYHRWPAIIGIIIASVIALSIIWCLARCLCCGVECCCGCFACLNVCCPSRRRRDRPAKYADSHPPYQPYQGYQPTPAPPVYSAQPQYARFDASQRGKPHDDSLPTMPSWDTANSRKVFEEHKQEDVELGRLDPMQEQKAPLVANQAPTPRTGYGEPNPSSPGLTYQQYGAYNGGDLGNPYAGENLGASQRPFTTSPTSPQSYHNPGFGKPQPAYQSNSPYQQPYSAYSSSQSTRYEPLADGQQEIGTTYNSRPSPPYPLQSSGSGLATGVPPTRKPIQNSWREI